MVKKGKFGLLLSCNYLSKKNTGVFRKASHCSILVAKNRYLDGKSICRRTG